MSVQHLTIDDTTTWFQASDRNVFIGDGPDNTERRAIYQIAAAPLREAFEYFERLRFSGAKKEIADKIINEIRSRLRFLVNADSNEDMRVTTVIADPHEIANVAGAAAGAFRCVRGGRKLAV